MGRGLEGVVPTARTACARLGLLAGLLSTLTVQSGDAQPAGQGDAARGAKLFAERPCVSCHDVTRPWPGGDICPNLGNIATEAARIVRSREYHGKARTPAEYIRESIVDPNVYIVPGASYRTADGQSVMPKDFGTTLSPAEIDDLVAYLLTRH
jgi:mono/diheme cytochrome c family protein